ncbi:HMCN [Mytilus coruscus]|uniref:HMCN n=1 Tax=Mytilus coruscus TaxID=42192 RepID=A0A6J8CSF2_MYTCO|nr:HMCN [Mytilus coruscus]
MNSIMIHLIFQRLRRQSNLGWETLQSRRTKVKTILLYKIVNHLVDIPTEPYLMPTSVSTRGHNIRYLQPHCRTLVYQHSFFPSAIRIWNYLPQPLATSSQSPPGSPIITGPDDGVLSGTEVTLRCSSAGGSPAPTVKWIENDTEITDGVSTISNGSTVTTSLTFIASKKAYIRFFLCQANNSALEKPLYANTFVEVYYLPDVTASPALQFVNTSVYPVTIMCSVSANPDVKYYAWRKISLDGQTNITIDEKESDEYSIFYYKNSSELKINNVIFNDDADYVCFAANAVGIGVSNNARVDVIGSTPQVSIPQSEYSVTYGENITIPCTIVGAFPAPFRVTWFYTNRENQVSTVNVGDPTQYSGGTLNNPALTILNANNQDAGLYKCEAENQVDNAQSDETLLNVLAEPIAIYANVTQYYPFQNTTITLHCKVTQGTAFKIQWYKDGSALNINSNSRLSGGNVATESLTITNVQRSDGGIYICQATDAVYDSIVNTDSINVTLVGLPVVQITPTNYTATYGNQVDIYCNIVSSSPAVTSVFWQRSSNNQILRIDSGDSGYQGSTPKIPSLTINIATMPDEGTYTCHAINDVGTGISNTGTVTITGGLLSVSVSPRSSNVAQGDSFKINCTVTGTPSATDITWLFTSADRTQESILSTTNSNKYTVGTTQDPYLTLFNFQLGDSGTYICRATNPAGSTSSNPGSTLTYISIPSTSVEPSQFTATVGDVSFQIQCTVTAIPEAIAWYWTFQPVGGTVQTIPQGSNNQQYTIESSGINPHLTIRNIAFEEAGVYTCYATNAAGTSDSANNRTGNSHHTLTVTGDGKKICEENIDKFYTKWGKALEKTLASVPCTGEYNGSVSRYCRDGGSWDDPDYSQCIRKSIEYLQDQSTKLIDGESVDTISLLANLEILTKESNGLRSGDLVASSDILNDIAIYVSFHTEKLSVDQLEENSVTTVLKAVSAYNSIFYEMINGEFTLSIKKKNIVIELGKTRSVEITVPGCSQTSDWLGNLATEIKLKKIKHSDLTGYSSTFYRNISRLFPEYLILNGKVQSFNGSYDVNSIITDFTVGTTSSPDYILNIRFDHLLDNYSRPFCGFWDFHVSNAVNGAWSSFGSRIVKSTDSYTICEYNHTTNFAILMSPGRIVCLFIYA